MSTGRGVILKMDTVDEARSIDILTLQKKGFFKLGTGSIWTSTWKRRSEWGEEVTARVSFQLEKQGDRPSALRLMYSITDRNTGEKIEYNYPVHLTSTPCNFGGERWWFVCPLIVNGVKCTRRARIIYLSYGATYFGCRECHRLSYDSRQLSGSQYEGLYRELRKQRKEEEKWGL